MDDFEREYYRYDDCTKFIDSSNYIPMHLPNLPKAFGLRDTLGKDFSPHLFKTLQNQNYIGSIFDDIIRLSK